jgi:hypothetical protein
MKASISALAAEALQLAGRSLQLILFNPHKMKRLAPDE